ncbi:MAG: N-acetylglucosamine kinase [Rhizobiaceae bacterium]|nr:MAG: N-acetylglucosamine kinase [Rhizobiaceae bacterium]
MAARRIARLDHLIAIDGGGTGCRALVATMGGVVLGRGASGSANLMTDPEGTCRSVVEAVEAAFADAGLPAGAMRRSGAFLGLAGANVSRSGERLKAMLPFSDCVVVTDSVIAMEGALGPADGVVAILGTGSVFVARSAGEVRSIGGWGFVLSDLGSGARLGRALLQEVLLAYDRVHRPSALTDEVLTRFGNEPGELVAFARTAAPRDFGTFAPLLFSFADRGDPVATRVLDEAVKSIGEALDTVKPKHCERICLLGGLAPLYAKRLESRFQHLLKPPLADALQGALALARKAFVPAGGLPAGVGHE